MRANTDPQGMTDDELADAHRHHFWFAEAHRNSAHKALTPELAAATVRLAAVHRVAAESFDAELKKRGK
jgi:hypothetical protein